MSNQDKEYNKLYNFCATNNHTCMMRRAMSGSLYVTVNGRKFRVSDHFQPSNYQIRNYTDISCISQIKEIMMLSEATITLADFIELYKNGGVYNSHEIVKSEKYGGSLFNGFGYFLNIEDAANNLYHELFTQKN